MKQLLLTALALPALCLAAMPAQAQADDPPVPATTDSGVIVAPKQERIPLEQFMVPLGCPPDSDEICVEGRPEEEEAVPTPEPGDRKLDAAAERKALSELGSTLPSDCNAIGPGSGSACAFKEFENWKEERELLNERYLPPEPE